MRAIGRELARLIERDVIVFVPVTNCPSRVLDNSVIFRRWGWTPRRSPVVSIEIRTYAATFFIQPTLQSRR